MLLVEQMIHSALLFLEEVYGQDMRRVAPRDRRKRSAVSTIVTLDRSDNCVKLIRDIGKQVFESRESVRFCAKSSKGNG